MTKICSVATEAKIYKWESKAVTRVVVKASRSATGITAGRQGAGKLFAVFRRAFSSAMTKLQIKVVYW